MAGVWRAGPTAGFQKHVDGIRTCIPEIEPDAPVGKLRDRCGDGAGREIPSSGKNDSVTRTAQAPVEDLFVAIQAIADEAGVSLGDSQSYRLPLFHARKW